MRARDATHRALALRARGLALLVLAIPVLVLGDRLSAAALLGLAIVWAVELPSLTGTPPLNCWSRLLRASSWALCPR